MTRNYSMNKIVSSVTHYHALRTCKIRTNYFEWLNECSIYVDLDELRELTFA